MNPTVPHHGSLVRTGAAVVVLVLVTVLAGAGPGRAALATTTATTPPAAWQQRVTPGWTDDQAVRGWITRKLRHMTLAEKVGQLFVTYAYGETADTTNPADVVSNRAVHGVDNARALIDKYHLGGIIYFAWSNNVNNPPQIARLSNGLQQVAMHERTPIPLLITTDQEQGVVVRVGPPATQFPGNMALGAGRSQQDAYDAAGITGKELKAMGINQDFAPVSDVNVNPLNPVIGVRSFGGDPSLVSGMVAAQVQGYQDAGIASTAKHFPGHGDTNVDSHTGVPIINHTRAEWEQIDAPPFRAAVDRGIDAIMTAHIIVPALDPAGDPATLSKPILTGILRQQMGYDGVVITDALGMQGVRDKYGDDRVPVLALKAGLDQLLMPPDIDLAYNSVLSAVRSGEISQSRIDRSVYRILRLKLYRGLFDEPYVDEGALDGVVGTSGHLTRAQEITDRTVTLVKNDDGTLPLSPGTGSVLVTGWGVTTTQTLANRIVMRGPATSVYETGANPDQTKIDMAVTKAQTSDLVVVTTSRAWDSSPTGANGGPGQQLLVRALLASGTPVIAAAVRDPYDIAYFTGASTYVATYSYTGVSLEALAKVLFGEVAPHGKLPVTIPVAGDPGTALYPYGHGVSW